MKKEILIGFLVGLIATGCGFYIYVEFVSTYSFEETIKILNEGNLYGKVLGLAAIPNLFVFFISQSNIIQLFSLLYNMYFL